VGWVGKLSDQGGKVNGIGCNIWGRQCHTMLSKGSMQYAEEEPKVADVAAADAGQHHGGGDSCVCQQRAVYTPQLLLTSTVVQHGQPRVLKHGQPSAASMWVCCIHVLLLTLFSSLIRRCPCP
jgi:hypothetical protein